MPRRPALLAALEKHLLSVLPGELAEVALPACRWSDDGAVVTLAPATPFWDELLRQELAPPAQAWLATRQRRLRQPGLAAGGPGERRFASFLADPGNQLALTAARRVVESPGLEHNPLYLHGPAGCGKSHLLEAIAAEYLAALGPGSALLIPGPEFVAAWASRLGERSATPERRRLEEAALLAIDGVDALAGRRLAQEELFHLVNAGLERGQQLVFAGRSPPRQLDLEERLTTRFGWGLALGIDLPQLETRLAWLGRLLPDGGGKDAAELTRLVETTAPDMHQVEALARRLAGGTGSAGVPDPVIPSFDRILRTVAERFDLRPGDLAGKRRHAAINRARGLALLLGRRLTPHSLEALGGMVGGRSHATVLHAIHQTEERLRRDRELQREVATLTQALQTWRGG